MKKILLAVTVMALTFSNTNAYDFKYLAFEKSDGQVLRFSVEDVVIQKTNGTLVVTVGVLILLWMSASLLKCILQMTKAPLLMLLR